MRTVLVVIGVLAVALAGCAQPGGAIPGNPPTDGNVSGGTASDGLALGPDQQACEAEESAAPAPTALPADAVLVRVTRCVGGQERVPGDGEWLVRHEQEATSGLQALADALRLPSAQPSPDTACPAIGYIPIVLSVTDSAGRQLRPEIPHEACGAPLSTVTDAIAALPWTTTATTRVSRISTELSVTSGCSDQWKPMIDLTVASGAHAPTSIVDPTPRPLRVCRYDIVHDPDLAVGPVGGIVTYPGTLRGSSTLDPDAAHQLLVALNSAAAPTGTCQARGSSFAVVTDSDGAGSSVTIELAGCYRALLDADGSLRQLDRDLVARLLG
jgi:hypothetical protein